MRRLPVDIMTQTSHLPLRRSWMPAIKFWQI